MMGGEESGGYGFGMHLPERDGIYADLLLLDLFIREREAGRWPVSSAVAAPARHRRPVVLPAHRCPRRPGDLPGAQGPAAWSSCGSTRRRPSPVSRSSGPTRSSTNDGFKFWVADGSWLLVRFSGTEPLVRVYAEATTRRAARCAARRGRPVRDGRRERALTAQSAASSMTCRRCARLDRRGMLGAVAALPGQVRDAWARSRSLTCRTRTVPPGRWRSWAWVARPSAVTWSGASGPTACACPSRSSAATTCRPGSVRRRSWSPARTAVPPRRPSAPSGRPSNGVPGGHHQHRRHAARRRAAGEPAAPDASPAAVSRERLSATR